MVYLSLYSLPVSLFLPVSINLSVSVSAFARLTHLSLSSSALSVFLSLFSLFFALTFATRQFIPRFARSFCLISLQRGRF